METFYSEEHMKDRKKKNRPLVQNEPPYRTLAMADDSRRDPKTNAAIPSKEAVDETRNWSIENKL